MNTSEIVPMDAADHQSVKKESDSHCSPPRTQELGDSPSEVGGEEPIIKMEGGEPCLEDPQTAVIDEVITVEEKDVCEEHMVNETELQRKESKCKLSVVDLKFIEDEGILDSSKETIDLSDSSNSTIELDDDDDDKGAQTLLRDELAADEGAQPLLRDELAADAGAQPLLRDELAADEGGKTKKTVDAKHCEDIMSPYALTAEENYRIAEIDRLLAQLNVDVDLNLDADPEILKFDEMSQEEIQKHLKEVEHNIQELKKQSSELMGAYGITKDNGR